MGKKSKRKKLKKKLRKMIRVQMAQSEQSKNEEVKAPKPIKKTSTPKEAPPLKVKQPQIKKASFTQRLNPYFSYDLKRVLVTIGVTVVIIITLFLISRYTNWINIISERLAQIINL